MKDDSKSWLAYAEENLTASDILQGQGLYNPCLQNIPSVECCPILNQIPLFAGNACLWLKV